MLSADELAQSTLTELGVIEPEGIHRYSWHYDFVQAAVTAMDRKRWTDDLAEYETKLERLPGDKRYTPQEVESIGADFRAHIAELRDYLALLDTLETVTRENATALYDLILYRTLIDDLWMMSIVFQIALNKCGLWDTPTGYYQGWQSQLKAIVFEHLSDDAPLSLAAVEKLESESM